MKNSKDVLKLEKNNKPENLYMKMVMLNIVKLKITNVLITLKFTLSYILLVVVLL